MTAPLGTSAIFFFFFRSKIRFKPFGVDWCKKKNLPFFWAKIDSGFFLA